MLLLSQAWRNNCEAISNRWASKTHLSTRTSYPGRLPLESLESVDTAAGLHHLRPAYARTNVGSVDSQGDVSMQSKTAKAQFGVTGAGQTVGVLSDSFNNAARIEDGAPCAFALDPGVAFDDAADDVASGDLPVVNALETRLTIGGSIDEGRHGTAHS